MEDPSKFVLLFGKHKNKTLGTISEMDLQYLVWLAGVQTARAMQPSSVKAHPKVRAEQGDSYVKMAKLLVSGRWYQCLKAEYQCLSRVGTTYQYHPYGKRG